MKRTLTTHWLLSFLGDHAQARAWIDHGKKMRGLKLKGLCAMAVESARFCHRQSRRMLEHWRTCVRAFGEGVAA